MNQENGDVHQGFYKCRHCFKLFRRKGNLHLHVRHHLGNAIKLFECYHCPKKFFTLLEMKAHTRLHNQDSIKPTTVRSKLSMVWAGSSDEGHPFTCGVCGHSFPEKHQLARHFLFHSRVDRFKCDVCHQKFRYPSDVTSHKRWNHDMDLRCFQCETCGKRFFQRVQLERHIVSHKPIQCEVCDDEFPTLETKNEHRKIHLKLTVYRCRICMEFFTTLRSAMRLHKLRHRIASKRNQSGSFQVMPKAKPASDFDLPDSSCQAVTCSTNV